MVMEGDLTCDGEHTVECTDDVLWNCAPETCIILLISVTPINFMKRKKRLMSFHLQFDTILKYFKLKLLLSHLYFTKVITMDFCMCFCLKTMKRVGLKIELPILPRMSSLLLSRTYGCL